ncbi:MAG: hypothetical protein MJA82_18030 [Clostridia bacterium]|nr:hypothetical protein [Clostridia bacterium]
MFIKYEVGERISHLKNREEGMKFDMSDSGCDLVICFKRPTLKEIESIKTGSIQFGMFSKSGIIFILCKFENISWMDAPFHVALTKNLSNLQEIGEGKGYGCHITFADSATGEIKALRYVGLYTDFSRKLNKAAKAQMLENNFDMTEYMKKLNTIMRSYTIKDMVKYSEANCKIRQR